MGGAYLDVVDPQDQRNCFRCQFQSACRHQQRLYDILLQDIRDDALSTLSPPGFRAKLTHLPHVDPGVPFSESMLVPQFGNNCNWMQTSVLGEGSGNNLEGFRVGLEAICFFAF
jgi:hypothetical protein